MVALIRYYIRLSQDFEFLKLGNYDKIVCVSETKARIIFSTVSNMSITIAIDRSGNTNIYL